MSKVPTTQADLFSDEILEDPYPAYAEMRQQGSVVRVEPYDIWALTRYDAVRDALSNPESFSSDSVAFNEIINEAIIGTALATDPPHHERVRSVISHSLAPRALRGIKQSIDEKAEKLVSELLERGSFDAVDDFAEALPVSVVLDLIGLPDDVRKEVSSWSAAGFNAFGPMNERTLGALSDSLAQQNYIKSLESTDLQEGSFGRAAFEAVDRGEIDRDEASKLLISYLGAGLDTTTAGLANAVHLFAQHPDQWDLVRAEPERISAAFNEILRYDSPLQLFGRRATRDVVVDGVQIPEGASVAVMYGSGNRDERHFAHPDRFDIDRDASDHLGFGYGIHSCAGQGLARLEVDAALRALARRVRRFHVGEPTRRLNNVARTLEKLPVTSVELA